MRESYCLKNSFLNIGFLLRFVRCPNRASDEKPKTIVRNEIVLTAKQGYEKAIEATNPLDRTARKLKIWTTGLHKPAERMFILGASC